MRRADREYRTQTRLYSNLQSLKTTSPYKAVTEKPMKKRQSHNISPHASPHPNRSRTPRNSTPLSTSPAPPLNKHHLNNQRLPARKPSQHARPHNTVHRISRPRMALPRRHIELRPHDAKLRRRRSPDGRPQQHRADVGSSLAGHL